MDNVEEFGNDRGNAREMTGPESAAQNVRKFRHVDNRAVLVSGRIDVDHFRLKQQIRARFLEKPPILLGRPRIRREILVGTELQRIDEDTDDDAIGQYPVPG